MNLRIKQIRNKFEKTQKEFGESLGVSRDTYASYESGRVIPNKTFIQLLCSKYNVNENWLCTGDGDPLLPAGSDLDFEDIWTNIRVTNTENADFIKRIVRAYWSLSTDKQAVIMELIDKIAEK